VRTDRTLPTFALLAVSLISLAACVAVNEALTHRDLRCVATPDDLCLRIADFAVRAEDAVLDPSLVRASEMTMIQVKPIDCAEVEHGPNDATRCWLVEGEDPADHSGFGQWVYERPDGTLGVG
jgi:hypothetical protein